MWDHLPEYVQTQVYMSRPEKIKIRLAEMVYSDILNNLIGDYWITTIYWAVVWNIAEGSLDDFMPIPIAQNGTKRVKRATLLYEKSKSLQ